MAGTIILDTTILTWMERTDGEYIRQGGDPAHGVYAGLDRLMDAGFKLIIPNEVLREKVRWKGRAVSMGCRADGTPFLGSRQLKESPDRFAQWLGRHMEKTRPPGADGKAKSPVNLYASLAYYAEWRAAKTPDEMAPISIVAQQLTPGTDDTGPPNPANAQAGDIEILAITQAIRAGSREPLLVLAHDEPLKYGDKMTGRIGVTADRITLAGSYRHLLALIRWTGLETKPIGEAGRASGIIDPGYSHHLGREYRKNLDHLRLFAKQSAVVKASAAFRAGSTSVTEESDLAAPPVKRR
jgi:hypothetical protein